MDRDEMSNRYRGPSIDTPYQVSVHLAERFQRRRLKCEKLTDDGRRMFFKSSPLKPLGQMNRNLVGSIYGRSSIKIAYFVSIG
jgi:hypothetical protein